MSGENKLKASVCIVTYNNKDNINAAIDSIINTTASVETMLYICDNNSTDGTPELVAEKYPYINLIRNKENGGFAHGHNTVLPLLNSDYHFIVNPDIILKTDVIGEMCRFLEENPDIVMAVPKFEFENGEEQFTPKLTPKFRYMLGGRLEKLGGIFRKWRREYTFADRNVTEVTDVGFCSGCFIAVRTDIFKKINGFDERYFLYSEDADITRMAAKYGRTVYAPQFTVIHHWEQVCRYFSESSRSDIFSMFKYFSSDIL